MSKALFFQFVAIGVATSVAFAQPPSDLRALEELQSVGKAIADDLARLECCRYTGEYAFQEFTMAHVPKPGAGTSVEYRPIPKPGVSTGLIEFQSNDRERLVVVTPEHTDPAHSRTSCATACTFYGSDEGLRTITPSQRVVAAFRHKRIDDARPPDLVTFIPTLFKNEIVGDSFVGISELMAKKLERTPAIATSYVPPSPDRGGDSEAQGSVVVMQEIVVPEVRERGNAFRRARTMRLDPQVGMRPTRIEFWVGQSVQYTYDIDWYRLDDAGLTRWFPLGIRVTSFIPSQAGAGLENRMNRKISLQIDSSSIRFGPEVCRKNLRPTWDPAFAVVNMKAPDRDGGRLASLAGTDPGSRAVVPESTPAAMQRSESWTLMLAWGTGTVLLMIAVALWLRERKSHTEV